MLPSRVRKTSFTVFLLLAIFSFQTCSVLIKTPDEDGILYVWKEGDNMKAIAEKYRFSPLELKKINDIYDENDVSPGTALFIPGNFLPNQDDLANIQNDSPKTPTQRQNQNQNPANPRAGILESLYWPSKGTMSSPYGIRGKRMHYGIDLRSDKGRDIFAAQDGVVEYSGRRSSFGNVVIIRHGDKIRTLYAHNSRNYVKKGDIVKRGQLIAKMGRTGRATGVHLHFEVHRENKPLNPRKVLPKKTV